MTTILTPAQTCGPLFGFALIPKGITQSVDENDPRAIVLEGEVLDGEGNHIAMGGFVEFWSNEQATRVRTIDGRFRTVIVRPAPLALPDGSVLAPHLNIAVFSRGLARQLVTKMYFPDEAAANQADPLLQAVGPQRRSRLIAAADDGTGRLRFNIKLQGEDESVFFALDAEHAPS